MKILLVGIYLILTTSGLIFMKLGGNSGQLAIDNGNIGFTINWISAIGFVCYLASFLLFTKIITSFDLSYILPICTGIVQIISLIAAYFIFKENISAYSFIGIIIVIIGIVLMNIKK